MSKYKKEKSNRNRNRNSKSAREVTTELSSKQKQKQTTDIDEDGEDDEARESIEESGNYRLFQTPRPAPLRSQLTPRRISISNLQLKFQVCHKKFLRSFSTHAKHTHTCAPDTHTTTHNLPLGETNVN